MLYGALQCPDVAYECCRRRAKSKKKKKREEDVL
jgi:hypothetical protein